MSRKSNWNQKPGKDKDGKHRKETKEERKIRLKRQEEAREQCLRILPIAAGVMLVLVVLFGIFVSFISPKSGEQVTGVENASNTGGAASAGSAGSMESAYGIEIESVGGVPPGDLDETSIMETAKAALKDHLKVEEPSLTNEEAEAKASEYLKNADIVHPKPDETPDTTYKRISEKKSWAQSIIVERTNAEASHNVNGNFIEL